MNAVSHIEWTDATWNPLVGCTKVSAGCDHCYAETLVNRFAGHNKGFPNRFDVVTLRDDKMMTQPLRWRAPKRIFVNSLSDLFHADVPDEFIAKVFAVMALAKQHTFQLLTKRPARMRALLSSDGFWALVSEREQNFTYASGSEWFWDGQPLPNVWLGVSVENQQWADIRIPALLDTPAAVRWLSCEPLLGPVNLEAISNGLRMDGGPRRDSVLVEPCSMCSGWGGQECPSGPHFVKRNDGVDWVVAGGESGPGARPMHPDWARSLRDQCVAAGVPFLFKQWGESRPLQAGDRFPDPRVHSVRRDESGFPSFQVRVGKKAAGRELDGRTWDEYPAAVTA